VRSNGLTHLASTWQLNGHGKHRIGEINPKKLKKKYRHGSSSESPLSKGWNHAFRSCSARANDTRLDGASSCPTQSSISCILLIPGFAHKNGCL
jgi:hypothetical protein